MGKGRIELNTAGGLYIQFATEQHFERATGTGKIKIGLSYSCEHGTKERAKEHSTSCADQISNIALWAVDEGTDIPTPEGTLGGVFEMEQYLHSVFLAYGWKKVGEGTEWFAVPQSVAQMLNDIRANKNGANKKVNWAACPELARAYGYAPEHDEVPSFAEERAVQLKATRYTKISTVKRSKMEERMDAIAPRSYARDYMLRRGAVEC